MLVQAQLHARMNYRHAFHAGNFADVLKHAVLALILRHLNLKPAAWRFIDTHSGPGLYDLRAEAPQRTGELRSGVGRLAPLLGLRTEGGIAAPEVTVPNVALSALEPYAQALHAANPDGALRFYPGSPRIARALARRQDRLTLTELHEADAKRLGAEFDGDRQAKVRTLDGWLALGAFVPPKERRGLVLVDPPFEEPGEYERLAHGLVNAHRRWSGGSYLLWHAIKDMKAAEAYEQALFETGIPKLLLAELFIRKPTGTTFDGCGILAVNPPYTLQSDLEALLPFLANVLAQGPGASHRLHWTRGE